MIICIYMYVSLFCSKIVPNCKQCGGESDGDSLAITTAGADNDSIKTLWSVFKK